MLLKRLVMVGLCSAALSVSSADAGEFKLAPDALVFPDGSSLKSAPRDGKTILSGTVAPTGVANVGDFYLDTASHVLYGPYNGSWGTGVSLVGPKGDPGATQLTVAAICDAISAANLQLPNFCTTAPAPLVIATEVAELISGKLGKTFLNSSTWYGSNGAVSSMNSKSFTPSGVCSGTGCYTLGGNYTQKTYVGDTLMATESGNYSINSSGQIIITLTSADDGKPLNVPSNWSSPTITKSGFFLGSELEGTKFFFRVATPFTESMVSGQTIDLTFSRWVNTLAFSSTDHMATLNGLPCTWKVNANGTLTVTGQNDSITFIINSFSGNTYNLVYFRGSRPDEMEGPMAVTIGSQL